MHFRYDSIPDEIRRDKDRKIDKSISEVPSAVGDRQVALPRAPGSVLSQYLFNQRWVWKMGPSQNATLEERSIAQMLQTIIMYVEFLTFFK